jgi:hypothetical protein
MLLLLTMLVVSPQLLSAERYLRCKCEKYCSVKYLHYDTDHFWDRCGKHQKTYDDCDLQEIELELAYGITACDTLGVKGGYGYIEEDLDGTTCGFNDFEVNWNHLLFKHSSGSYGTRLIGIIPSESTYEPCLRYGQYGFEGGLFYSQYTSICNTCAHLYGDIGYRWYEGFPSDQLRNKLGVTFCFNSRFSLDLNNQIEFGLFNGDSRLDQSVVLMNPNYRLWKGEVEGKFRIYKNIRLSLGYFQHFLGQNVGTGGGFFSRLSICF